MIFLELIVALGLIAFPIVLSILKGTITYTLYWGIVFGIHYDKVFLKETYKDGSPDQIFRLNLIQFHLLCVTVLMSFTTKENNMTEYEGEE